AIEAAALSIRSLSMDGVEKANSGHPGLPMGCAELGALLYGEIMKHTPADPDWIDRDRFVLSAGHGSMLLYSLLHLSGYGVSLEDLKNFRQLGSITAGHPEYGLIKGIETTTGPLGAGFSNAVGFAIAEQMLGAAFNTDSRKIIDHFTYVLSGDGCMMEGITSEAASLAGHLGLGKLIVFYDSNHITIDGSTDIAFTEDVLKRYNAYNWQTLSCDAYDIPGIMNLVEKAKAETGKPTIILLNSIIGKGSPNMAGTHGIHGAPLGDEEIAATRKNLGIGADEAFYVAPEARKFFENRKQDWSFAHENWKQDFSAWTEENSELKAQWDVYFGAPNVAAAEMPAYEIGKGVATRSAGGSAQNAVAAAVPNLVGGSADLAASNKTSMPAYGEFSKENRAGRTINFGVREHGMGGVTNGITLHGGFRSFCATFLVFVDYMRPTVRLAALMKLPITYVFTHDSIFVGEDGPTHQPIEQIESLRIIPGVHMLRPADAEETNVAWQMALERTDGPTALALTRQNLSVFEKADPQWKENCRKGAYLALDCDGVPDVVVAATGSEVEMAIEAAGKSSRKVRVISVLSRELFEEQDAGYKKALLPEGVRVVVAEAGVGTGWGGIASSSDDILCINRFGESGKATEVAAHLGMTADKLIKLIGA
ncbi:MAG: transketolase, partial [Spirochaetales bacterium]|nr:transketolase [Spirochaetales bacterium]